jgi:CheY-like chemotaxis protein
MKSVEDARDATPPPPGEPRLQGVRVLMLDDEPDTLDALCTVLTMAGATVKCFEEPAAALTGVESFGPHVLVCDLYLPGTDGWMFMERVRARGLTIPAIAVTAHPSAANRERALACGYAVCVGKPLHPEDLVGLLRSVADARPPAEDPLGPEDRRVLSAIARQHGHGPRRTLALLDIAWAETGSERAGRATLQRLLLLGLIELQAGCDTTSDCLGWLSDEGARLVGYS